MKEQEAPIWAPMPPYCNPVRPVLLLYLLPWEYSVCYLEGHGWGPQAFFDASSQMELYDEELDCCPIEIGSTHNQLSIITDLIMPAPSSLLARRYKNLTKGQFLLFRGRHSLRLYQLRLYATSILI